MEAWNHFGFLCKNYTLNSLDNALYSVYSLIRIAKELWDSLEKKYKAKDVGLEKFVDSKFLEFNLIDSKAVMSQVQEL